MRFPVASWEPIARGEITVAFRRWTRPMVKTGGTLRMQAGVLAIDSVEPVALRAVTADDVQAAGFDTKRALVAALAPRGRLYRIEFHLAGPDPRIALREDADLDAAARAEIADRLEAIDARSKRGPWTRAMLDTIAANPEVRAPDLAAAEGRETKPFKADVRRLKELGLTESLPVGYRLSPRGRAFLEGA